MYVGFALDLWSTNLWGVNFLDSDLDLLVGHGWIQIALDMSSRPLQNLLKTFLQGAFKTSLQDVFKTSLRPTNACWASQFYF